MKRIKQKGFVLLETLIVTVFVMSIFVFVYRSSVPMMGQYEKMQNFDDIDSVYAADMMKRMITNYVDFSIVDEKLQNATYIDISNCNDTTYYQDASYCTKLKNSLHIEENDVVLLTKYNLSNTLHGTNTSFRTFVNENEYFDSGKLSNFRDYLKTVADNEVFYNPGDSTNKATGVYRLFISRTVPLIDGTTETRYANIGIYKSKYGG